MNIPFRGRISALTRQVSAAVLSVILLSGWGLGPLLPQNAWAIGIDAGGLGVTSGMADCSDSGVLVAFAGATRQEKGKCPLKHTDVKATVSGYVARVTVKQQFHNPFKEKIEALYTFPLPQDAAVDEMTMKVGDRVIRGNIKKREEARQVYEAARAAGHVASLLDQERPNIFNQSVANIEPGQNIDIEIKYVNLLKYEDGSFTFNFPTVVGPRFIPGNVADGHSGHGVSPDTDMVPDASKITPPTKAPGERAGHDISIDLNIDAAVPIQSVQSLLHDVDLQRPSATSASIKLKAKDKIPNKDFVAKWQVAADSVQSGYLTHRGAGKEGFFTMMLVPPKRVTAESAQPKEMIFLIDCSGSQSGRPIQKAKETMDYILRHMNPKDTFQVITFNSGHTLFPAQPEVASQSLTDRALSFINGIQAQGGTWMAPAVEAALNLPNPDHRLRIVTFMTDGYVGNDMQILSMIKKYRGESRWFSFGTGNSVNRFLIDNIAKEGGGEADYVYLNSSAEEAGKKFYDRIKSPVLTDIKVAFEGVEVKEMFPKDVCDLWAQRPLYFSGRYQKPGSGKVVLTGYSGGKPYKQELKIELPETQNANDVLPSIWARAKVDRLMSEDWMGAQQGNINSELKEEIVQTALRYHIMSQYTSFVAVEEDRKTEGGKPKQVAVPVEMPEGVEMEARSSYQAGPLAITNSVTRKLVPPYAQHRAGGSGGYGLSSAPAPVRASRGGGGGSSSYQHYGHYEPGAWAKSKANTHAYAAAPPPLPAMTMGLPQTNMGKFVHQPGDNQYYSSNSSSGSGNFAAKRQMQIVDERPAVRDYRSGTGYVGSSESLEAVEPKTRRPSHGALLNRLSADGDKLKSTSNGDSEKISGSLAALIREDEKTALKKIVSANGRELSVDSNKVSNTKDSESRKVNIKIELAQEPDEALLAKLKACGLEISTRKGRTISGKISLSAIKKLAGLAQVLRIKLN